MPLFLYQAKTTSGEIVKNTIEAESVKSVVNKLQELGYFPITINEQKIRGSKIFSPFVRQKISRNDLVIFTRQLAELLKGGLTLLKSLSITIRQTENKNLQEILKAIKNDVQEGSSFSQAINKYPQVFSKLYVGLVKAGESGGALEQVIIRLAEYNEKELALVEKIKSAMAYPVAMLLIGIGTIVFLLVFIIPKFVLLFQDVEQILPLPTRILIFASKFFKNFWWIYLPLLVFIVVGYKRYIQTPKGKLWIDNLKLNLPLLGAVVKNEIVVRFTRTLGTLLKNGVPLAVALEMVKEAVGNEIVSREVNRIYQEIKVGKGLVEPLSQSEIFPATVSDLVAAGQEVGSMENSLLRVADTYEQKVENTIKAVTSLLEPLVILLMGLLVGFIVMAMLLPIFEISSVIK